MSQKKAKAVLKRNCYECKALYSIRGEMDRCNLGYKVGYKRIYLERHPEQGTAAWVDRPIPLECCPKPRTYKQYYDCDVKKKSV